MPRTIDILVANHTEAARRRAAGQPVWDHHIKIKHLLTDDDSDANARRVGHELHTILTRSTWIKNTTDAGLEDTINNLRDADNADDLNYWLDTLYDYADRDRVWLG